MQLQGDICLNSSKERGLFDFGMRDINMALKAAKILHDDLNSLMTLLKSYLRISIKPMKKSTSNPSRLEIVYL
jgi:hypothetical protein